MKIFYRFYTPSMYGEKSNLCSRGCAMHHPEITYLEGITIENKIKTHKNGIDASSIMAQFLVKWEV